MYLPALGNFLKQAYLDISEMVRMLNLNQGLVLDAVVAFLKAGVFQKEARLSICT